MKSFKELKGMVVNAIGYGREPVAGQERAPDRPEEISVRSEQVAVPRNPNSRIGTTIREQTDPGVVRDMLEAAINGDHESAHRVFVTMENSWDRLVKNMHELRRAASRSEFVIKPYREKDSEPTTSAIEKADLVQRVIDNWKGDARRNLNSFNDFLYDIADAVGKGTSVQELRWEMVDGEWRVTGSYWCDPRYWGIDPVGEELGLRNIPASPTWTPFPEGLFVVGVFKNKSGPSLSYGLFRSIAWWWSIGVFSRQWLARYAELYGIPFRVVKAHPKSSVQERRDLLNDLVDMGDSGCIVVPDGAEVEIQEAAKNAGDSPQIKILEMRDRMIDILVLGQTLTTDVQDSGSRAVAEVHADVKTERKIEVSDWVAEIVSSQLIPAIIERNYGSTDELPVMTLDLGESGDPLEMAQRDQVLNQIMDLPLDYMQKRHRIPAITPGTEIVPKSAGVSGEPMGDPGFYAKSGQLVKASGTDRMPDHDALLRSVMEEVSEISADFLGPVKPIFAQIIALAQRGDVPDEEFENAVEKLIEELPSVYDRLDRMSFKEALEKAMGAASINGAYDRMTATPGAENLFISQ